MIEREKEQVQRRKEAQQRWYIHKGMSIEEVEKRAQNRGVVRYGRFWERFKPIGQSQDFFTVHDYRYKTKNFSHIKRIYFDRTDHRVVKVQHQATAR